MCARRCASPAGGLLLPPWLRSGQAPPRLAPRRSDSASASLSDGRPIVQPPLDPGQDPGARPVVSIFSRRRTEMTRLGGFLGDGSFTFIARSPSSPREVSNWLPDRSHGRSICVAGRRQSETVQRQQHCSMAGAGLPLQAPPIADEAALIWSGSARIASTRHQRQARPGASDDQIPEGCRPASPSIVLRSFPARSHFDPVTCRASFRHK